MSYVWRFSVGRLSKWLPMLGTIMDHMLTLITRGIITIIITMTLVAAGTYMHPIQR